MSTSNVRYIYINDLSDSCLFVCGEVGILKSRSTGRKEASESGKKAIVSERLESIPLKAFPVMLNREPAEGNESFECLIDSSKYVVSLGAVRVLSISGGTAFQIGPSDFVFLKSRITEINVDHSSDEE